MIWVWSVTKQANKKIICQQKFITNDHLAKQGLPNFTAREVEHHLREKHFKQAKITSANVRVNFWTCYIFIINILCNYSKLRIIKYSLFAM